MFAICNLSIAPVRSNPSDKSEMVTQLLFGEYVEIMEEKGNWLRVKLLYDDYTGWIDYKQIHFVADEHVQKVKSSSSFVSSDLVQLAMWNNNQACPVVIGSSLPLYADKKFYAGSIEFYFEGNVVNTSSPDPSRILDYAFMYLNSPYLWGGRSPFGIDCSGLTQVVFKLCGIAIKRDAAQQAEQGMAVGSLGDAKERDLAFFENDEGRISHVGIILPGNHIIHASGRVKIERLTENGILNELTGTQSHKLKVIKRFC